MDKKGNVSMHLYFFAFCFRRPPKLVDSVLSYGFGFGIFEKID